MKNTIVWVIVILVALVGGYFLITAPAQETGPIKIGVVIPITGDAASLGEFVKNVTDLAVEEINNKGGVNGQPISLIYEDDKCNPATTVSAAQKLISVDNVKIILGSSCSGSVIAMLPITEKAGVFVFSGTATSPDLTGKSPLFARTVPSDASQGKTLAEMAISRGWKKVAVIQEISDYALGVFNAFKENYPTSAGTIIKEEYPGSTTDFRSILTKIRSANPDVVFFDPQSPGTIQRIIKNFSDMKWSVPIMGSDMVGGNGDLLSANKNIFEGAFVAEGAFSDLSNEKYKALSDSYKNKYAKEIIYKAYSQDLYDLVYILRDGLEKYGNDPEKIASWVRTIKDYDGASGKVTIDSNGDRIGGFVVRVIKDGKAEQIDQY